MNERKRFLLLKTWMHFAVSKDTNWLHSIDWRSLSTGAQRSCQKIYPLSEKPDLSWFMQKPWEKLLVIPCCNIEIPCLQWSQGHRLIWLKAEHSRWIFNLMDVANIWVKFGSYRMIPAARHSRTLIEVREREESSGWVKSICLTLTRISDSQLLSNLLGKVKAHKRLIARYKCFSYGIGFYAMISLANANNIWKYNGNHFSLWYLPKRIN